MAFGLRCGTGDTNRKIVARLFRPSPAISLSEGQAQILTLPQSLMAGWALHPLEKRRLFTAHVGSEHSHRISAQAKRLFRRHAATVRKC
jgi:hypothetical protein